MSSTQIVHRFRAPPGRVYRALVDPALIPRWRFPEGMTCEIHAFEAREGGRFRVSLTYDAPTTAGKTSARTDTYHGRFERLVEDRLVVERISFETDDPSMQGEMTITTTLTARDSGTELVAEHADLPPGVSAADNETGWRMALANLERLLG